MKKSYLIGLVMACLVWPAAVRAQNVFWTFTDDQEPVMIPSECEARFDEVRGGVFVPTAEEVYTYGMNFLNSNIESVQKQAPYCFLAAALEGHTLAQLELARMYNQGKYLPKDDLSAYKWSFIAALDGNKDAERFALTLEQFLTTSDLEITTNKIQEARIQIETARQAKKNKEAAADGQPAGVEGAVGEGPAGMVAPNALLNIFKEEDRLK